MEVEERSGENAVFRSSFHLPLNKQRDPEGYFTAAGQMLLIAPPPITGGRQRQEATLGNSEPMRGNFITPHDSFRGLLPPSWLQQPPARPSASLSLPIPPSLPRARSFRAAPAFVY